MLLSPNSRFFVRHELSFRPQRDQGAALALRAPGDELDIISVLEEAVADGSAVFQVKDDTEDYVRLTHVDVRPRSNLVALLFRRSADGPPPIFENRRTRVLRRSDKTDEDLEAVSAHLFISLDEALLPFPTHRALLEEVPGLSRTYVTALLRNILRGVVYGFTDERGMQRETYTIPQFGGVPSETVGDAVRGGGIKYIELVRTPRLDGLDTSGLIAHPERMRLSVKSDRRGNMDLITRVRGWADQHDWRGMRVQVQTSDDRTRVVEIAREADAADVLFIKSELVEGINPPLEQCTEHVVDALVSRARRMLEADDGWR